MPMTFRIDFIKARSTEDIRKGLFDTLKKYGDLLPARILLKPNLNSNMNALTGNTTDLRLIGAVIKYLKGREYENITIDEGTNSGYYRSNISVISRLKVDKLAEYYSVRVSDLNYSETVDIDFENGIKAAIAKKCCLKDILEA